MIRAFLGGYLLPFFLIIKHDVGPQIQNDAASVSEMVMLWDYQ